MTQPTYTIKPLRWRRDGEELFAETCVADYSIEVEAGHFGLFVKPGIGFTLVSAHLTVALAQKRAQADHARRIRKGLRRVKG